MSTEIEFIPEVIELPVPCLPVRPPVLDVGEDAPLPVLLDGLDLQVLEHVHTATGAELEKKRKHFSTVFDSRWDH